jgi:hypothetical protein
LRLLAFQLGDALLRGVERLVGDDRMLDQQIGRIRIGRQRAGDHRLGLAILGAGPRGGQLIEETGEKGAFFGVHRGTR